MRARRVGPLGTVGILLFLSTNASAQLPVSFGLGVGRALALSPEMDERGGISFDIFAAYRIRPTLSVYLMSGVSWFAQFRQEQDVQLLSYTLGAGVESTFGRLSVGRLKPFFQAGLGLYSLSSSQTPELVPPLFYDILSPARFGFHFGVGVMGALTSRWYVTPAVRFDTFAADWAFWYWDSGNRSHVRTTIDRVSYVILDVGLRYNFGIRDVR